METKHDFPTTYFLHWHDPHPPEGEKAGPDDELARDLAVKEHLEKAFSLGLITVPFLRDQARHTN